MYRLLAIYIAIVASLPLPAQDTTGIHNAAAPVPETLNDKLEEYFTALETKPANVKCIESDFIISSCTDLSIRRSIAIKVYNHFRDSKVMGDDAVAIYIFDKWFADGTVEMENEADLWAARLFAATNRQSLIGFKAPVLKMIDAAGKETDIFGNDADKRFKILYFYDTECAKCKIESILLRNILENNGANAVLYAIYTGHEKDKWEAYRKELLDIHSPGLTVVHLYDPDMSSDFTMKYGVTSTPKIFLVDGNGIIAGRGLDARSLEQLLNILTKEQTMEYGSDESVEMYDKIFSSIQEKDCNTISEIAGYASGKALEMRDTAMYKQLIGDLLYYISNQRTMKCGLPQFADKYILDRKDIWNTPDDTLQIISLAELLKHLSGLTPVGSKMAKIKVPGELKKADSSKKGVYSLDKLKNTIIIFHTDGCNICKSEIAAADELLKSKSADADKVFLVDMDEIFSGSQGIYGNLMANIDLSSLPMIISTDKKARVRRKYISFVNLSF